MRTQNIARERGQTSSYLRSCVGVCFCILLGGLFTASSTRAEAEAQNATAIWADISRANKPINACRVVWRRVLVIKPNPQVNVDKRVAETSVWAQQQGLSASEVQRLEQAERREAQRDIQGRTVVSELTCVRVGSVMKCDVFYPELKSRTVDFYDGVNAVSLRVYGEGAQKSADGDLSRDTKPILLHSIGTGEVARFLLGIPLQQGLLPWANKFSPENTRVSKDANGNFLLDVTTAPSFQAPEYPGPLTISKENLHPIAYKSFNMAVGVKGGQMHQKGNTVEVTGGQLLPAKGASYRRITLAGYTQFDGGVSFPSKITATTPALTVEYSLIKAAFNEAIDPMELRLPAGTRMADARFGRGGKMAIYKLKNGQLPSDEEVRRMLGQEQKEAKAAGQAATEAKNEETKQLSALPVTPGLGLLFMALGGVLWTRSRGHTDNKPQ